MRRFKKLYSGKKSKSRRVSLASQALTLENLETRSMLSVSPSGVDVAGSDEVAHVVRSHEQQAALNLIANDSGTAYLQEGLNGLQWLRTESGEAGTTTQFQQTYAGLPVFNAIVTVSQDSQGDLNSIYNHGRPDLDMGFDVGPGVSQTAAIDIAEADIDGQVNSEAQQTWYSNGRQVRLAIQVNTFGEHASSASQFGDYVSIVDAFSGELLIQDKTGADFLDQFESDSGVFPRIVINNNIGAVGSRNYAAPFDAVVELSQGCTGTLIAPNVVVSARHCGGGSSVRFGNTSSSVLTVPVSSTSYPAGGGSLLDGGDVSIVTLSQNVPSSIATPMRLIEAGDSLEGEVAVTLGYGYNGLGSVGHGFSSDGWRWGGENIIDAYGSPAGAGGSNIFSTDFDNASGSGNTIGGSDPVPLEFEATTAPGDSGGPLLVQTDAGEWVIAGVLSGGTSSTSVYGDISWWTGVAPFRTQIESAGGEFLGGGLGIVEFDAGTYMVNDTVTVTLRDPNAVAPLEVTLTSDSGDSETVALSSTGGNQYSATISTTGGSVSAEDGSLQVALFDDIQVTYQDVDDGTGSPNTATDSAMIANVEHYVSSDVPVAIQDLQTVRSDIVVSDEGSLVDLNVQINITHTWDEDLDVFLVGPDGTRVELFSDVGSSGNNFSDTILDDEASASIVSGGAPFTGSFRPEASLSAFDGMSITGTWTLEIFDDFSQDQGTLHDWCLYVSAESDSVVGGDFNGDGAYNCDDINGLIATIADGTNDASFDLTGDGIVDLADRDAWLAEAGEANLGAERSYLVGDANLDGLVNGDDFVIWNANKFTSGGGWCSGDFNGDGVVDGGDFIGWNANKFQSSDQLVVATPVTNGGEVSRSILVYQMSKSEIATEQQRLSVPHLAALEFDLNSSQTPVRTDVVSSKLDGTVDAVDELAKALCLDDCRLG